MKKKIKFNHQILTFQLKPGKIGVELEEKLKSEP